MQKKKSNVFSIFAKYKVMVEKYFKTFIVTMYSDGSGEYLDLKSMIESHGIQHLFSPPHTSQHISFA